MCISIMFNMRNNNRHSKRGSRTFSRHSGDDNQTSSPLWNLFYNSPKHCVVEYIKEQICLAGANIISDNCDDRHIITNKRRNMQLSNIVASCVGSIIRIVDGKLMLVSYMPPSPIKLMDNNIATVSRNFNKYVPYPITDGTSIGLYFFNDAWIIRTLNGYDVRDYEWNGNYTYLQVFNEVMSKYKSFSMENLDKQKCYTIIIKHPAFHPFREGGDSDIMRATLVHSINCAKVSDQNGIFNNAISTDDDIGIPCQMPIANATMHTLMRDASTAYDRFVKENKVFLGAILIGNTDSFVIPSDMYDVIVSTLYTNTSNKNIYAGSYDRQKYMILSAYLHMNRSNFSRFQRLFPQFANIISRFESVTSKIVESMISCIEKKQIASDETDETTQALLRQLSHHAGGMPKLDKNITYIITRFVRNSANIAILYDLMYGNDNVQQITSQFDKEVSLDHPEVHNSREL